MLEIKQSDKTGESSGLRDGGHECLDCSNCGKQLMDIWITRPDENSFWKIRAKCPYCGDKSFIKEIRGGFGYGGIPIKNPDNPDEDELGWLTIVPEFPDIEGDCWVFDVKNAKEMKNVSSNG